MKQYALLSCYNKEGITDIAEALLAKGMELLATGGTYEVLKGKYPVTEVAELTKKPEIFGGRVKTLQYEILGSILLRKGQDEKEWPHDFCISAVVCNFYPFQEKAAQCKSMAELLEWIDIGGPTMVRASAKNFPSVYCLTHPRQYVWMKENPFSSDEELRAQLSVEAFDLIHHLDEQIAFELHKRIKQDLRYGENPHQKAVFLSKNNFKAMGAAYSFNNVRDAEAALRFVLPFQGPAVSVVKHGTLCGAAVALSDEQLDVAFSEAWEGDTVSRFGGIIAFNRCPSEKVFEGLVKKFIECLVLPNNADSAAWAERFLAAKAANKSNCKIFLYDPKMSLNDHESITGIFGSLIQDRDTSAYVNKQKTLEDLETFFAIWTAACSKSNAITLVGTHVAKNLCYLAGTGQGQPNRVEALEKLALPRAKDFCQRRGFHLSDLLCSSDAFFPFDDIVKMLAEAGIKRVLQPGGSKNDAQIVATAEALGLSMPLTGERHFWH